MSIRYVLAHSRSPARMGRLARKAVAGLHRVVHFRGPVRQATTDASGPSTWIAYFLSLNLLTEYR